MYWAKLFEIVCGLWSFPFGHAPLTAMHTLLQATSVVGFCHALPVCRYFLVICILQAIPVISITNGVPTTAAPLAFVLLGEFVVLQPPMVLLPQCWCFTVDGLFTALQDYNRHTADRRVNVLTKVCCAFPAASFCRCAVPDIDLISPCRSRLLVMERPLRTFHGKMYKSVTLSKLTARDASHATSSCCPRVGATFRGCRE